MSRVNRGLLALAALLAILSLVRIVGGSSEDSYLLEIAALPSAQVQFVSISSPEASIQLHRTEAGWSMTSPEQLPANTQRIEALLADWAGGMRADKTVSIASNDSEESRLGLDIKHRIELQIGDAEGVLVHLEVGRSVAGGSHYIRVAGTDEVFQARVPGGTRLDPSLSQWVQSQD